MAILMTETAILILNITHVKIILCPTIEAEKLFLLIFLLFVRVVGHIASLVSRVSAPVSDKYLHCLGRRQSETQYLVILQNYFLVEKSSS